MPLFCEASAQAEQVSKSFFNHLLKLSKSRNLFSTVCSKWASLKLFSWPFAQVEQVSILFFGVCSRWADTQFYFLRFAQVVQASNFIFWGLLKPSRCSNLFFEVCSSRADAQFYFLEFAQAEQALQFIFRGLLKLSRRGGACVPARTSAQRRFHTKICLYIMHYEHR